MMKKNAGTRKFGLDTEKIRKDFPILERNINGKPLIYLDSAATSQKPQPVLDAIMDYYSRHNANVHRGVHTLSGEATTMVEEARDKVASFIGAKREEIVFVRNATEAANLILYSWGEQNLHKGDEVVVSLLEHHSNFVGWQQLANKKKMKFKVIDISPEGILKIEGSSEHSERGVVLGSLATLLNPHVKVVAVTHVSNVLGTIVPLQEVIAMVRRKAPKAIVVVDAAQSVPHMPVSVKDIGADFLFFSGHKMLGPTGIGVLWGRERLFASMPPFLYGGDMISEVYLDHSVWNRLPWKFEAGTPNMAGMVGMGAAVDYLSTVGMQAIRDHEKRLVSYALPKLESLEDDGHIKFYGPRSAEKRAGVLTFSVLGVHAHDAAQVLDSQGIAVRSGHHCAMPLTQRLGTSATLRASLYLYTSEEEINRLIEGIRQVNNVFRP